MSEPRRGRKIKLLHGQTVLNISNKNKKRRRPTGENHSTNKRRNSLPDLSNVHNIEDTHQNEVSEITAMMSKFQVESSASANSMLEEIKKMEERLSEKITSNKDKEISELEERLNNNIRSTIVATSATFGLRTWGPPLTKSWIRTCERAINRGTSEEKSIVL